MTENARGWLAYDANCGFCLRWAGRVRAILLAREFHLVALQSVWVRQRLALSDDELLREMKLILPDRRVLGGADALVELARHIWWTRPLFALAHLPGAMPTLRVVYGWIARNRHRLNCDCVTPPDKSVPKHHRASSFYELP